MGYTIEKDNVRWARTRVQQLKEARLEIGCVVEKLEGIPKDLRGGALLMDDQPDSDVIRSYADDYEKLYKGLRKTFSGMEKDLKALQTGIRKYEEASHDYDS